MSATGPEGGPHGLQHHNIQRRAVITGLAGLTLVTAAGCGGAPPIPTWEAPKAGEERSFDDALALWTRSAKGYKDFETRFWVTATWLSPDFVSAWTAREGQVEGLTKAEISRRRAERLARARREARLFVSVATRKLNWNDLDRPDGTLRIVLRQNDGEIKPLTIRRLSRQESDDVSLYFPYLTDLTNGYWVTFPMPDDARRITLRVAGPPGSLDLDWQSR